WDEVGGVFRLDRVLSSAVYYNFEYGFIEGTRADDGDHTDALVVIDEPTFPGCRLWARPIGVLEMRDEKGADYKLLCVAEGDPRPHSAERGGSRRDRWRGGRRDPRFDQVDPPGTARLFFAVPLSGEAKARVGRLIDEVQSGLTQDTGRVRWVRVEGLHLTLRF